MFSTVTRLFINNQIKFNQGKLEVLGVRDSFTPAETYVEMLKILLEFGDEEIIYRSAKTAGWEWFSKMRTAFPGMKQLEAINWGVELVTLSGWGIATLEKADLDRKIFLFGLKNSTTAKLLGKSEKPVDHLFRGLIAGGGSFIMKTELDAIERTCLSSGGKYCQFIVAPKQVLESNSFNL